MKKLTVLTILALLLQGLTAAAQQTDSTKQHLALTVISQQEDQTKQLLDRAKLMATTGSKVPGEAEKALAIYSDLAQKGNTEAMNGLAQMYSRGIGTVADGKKALSWFKKSAAGGYAPASFNAAMCYRNGLGAQQNFAKAYAYFERGAALGYSDCIYGQGYMLHKGYGTTQNYAKAVTLFKQGAAMGNRSATYMLGLCYRNGYGTAANTDSAKYFLIKAATMGDKRAQQELQRPRPENLGITQVPQLQAPAATGIAPVDLSKGLGQINHTLYRPEELSGDYEGYSIKFDWSGRHIIGKDALKLSIKYDNGTVSGTWAEQGQQPVAISGTLTDTALLFNNTRMERISHYHPDGTEFVFKDARLRLAASNDTVYLSGSLRSYWPAQKEPQKPEFIMLVRRATANSIAADIAGNLTADTDSLSFRAYPNPFGGKLSLSYTLHAPARVYVTISDVMTGAIVYRGKAAKQQAGQRSTTVAFNGRPGSYVVTLHYNGKTRSAIVFKE